MYDKVKVMEKYLIVIIVILLSLSSCRLALGSDDIPQDEHANVQSVEYVTLDCIDMFSINGKGYTTIKASLPVLVYNPNLYTIDVIVNGSAILYIESHEEKGLY